jgi:hypothetical protein
MNFRINLNSLTTRLILFGMALLLAGALGRILLLSDFLSKGLTELTSSQLSTLANYVAQDVDQDIVERRRFLERAASKFPLALLHNPQKMQLWLREYHEINPLFKNGMFVLDSSGVALADYPPLSNRVGQSYADRDYFQQAMIR